MPWFYRMQYTETPYALGPADGWINYYTGPTGVALCLRWSRTFLHGHCWIELYWKYGLFLEAWRSPTQGTYKEWRWASKS